MKTSDPGDFAAVVAGLAKLCNRQYHREPLSKALGNGLFELRHVSKLNTRVLWFFMNRRGQAGLTLVELLVLIVILLVLAFCCHTRCGTPMMMKHGMTEALSNMKQLHLTCQQMVLDGETTGDKSLGWPGSYATWGAWTAKVAPGYVSTNDLCKLLSAPGFVVPPGKIPPMKESAVRVYAVTKDSPTNAVLLTSANFTNTPTGGEPLNPSAKPFGNKGFVVFRKSGDGAIYRPNQTGQTNIIGAFVPMCR